ncbi:efflux RND transporter permease subunit [Parasphingopyxis algicola]|uniref:efflux RND transporter permease subunit n=1 Tax=Parasphingopyxis algicola TaxID=2026624 RepID=UPI0015A3CA8C|nr:efflux RND transporter permease subunit [Parasphingopyxis algicola]QLC26010.1 efflux RND transporter permease subunit [Parasphingopyxis algicola]
MDLKPTGRSRPPLFLRNAHLLYLTITIILFGGLIAFGQVPRIEDPRITQRNPIVLTALPGASAERVEALITEHIEDRLQEIPEIDEINSTSRAGLSVVSIELIDAITTSSNEEVFSEIRDRLADAATEFPASASDPVFDDKRGAVAFTYIAAFSWESNAETQLGILARLSEDLADGLRNIDGTEIVRIYGAPDEEITVTPDPSALALHGLDPQSIATALERADSRSAAGTLRGETADIPFEVEGEFGSLGRIGSVPLITDENGEAVRLSDIADIARAWREPPQEIGLSDDRRTIFVAARIDDGERVDVWRAEVQSLMDRYRDELGPGIILSETFDQSHYTVERLGDLGFNLLLGAIVVMLVVLAVMGWRSALIVSSSLPLVGATVLLLVMMMGGALHQMSIFGMIIALGLLIDNAIVIVDETNQNLGKGMEAGEAMQATLAHLAIPLFASTLTTVIAFAPIVLLPGNAGDFVGWIGISVILAIASSYVLAITVIAALAAQFGRPPENGERTDMLRDGVRGEQIAATFGDWLRRAIRTPRIAFAIAFAAPVLGFLLTPTLGNQFFPPIDRDMFEVRVWMPQSTSLSATRETARRIEGHLREDQAVRGVDWLVGGSFPSVYYNQVMDQDAASHFAHAIVSTADSGETARLVPQLERDLVYAFPEARIVVRKFGQGPPVDAAVQFELIGPSIAELQQLGEVVRLGLTSDPDVLVTEATLAPGEPKLWVDADEDEASALGLTLDDVARQIRNGLDGAMGGSILEEIEELPVRIRFEDDFRADSAAIATQNLITPSGDFVPLSSIGGLRLAPETAGITHVDGPH